MILEGTKNTNAAIVVGVPLLQGPRETRSSSAKEPWSKKLLKHLSPGKESPYLQHQSETHEVISDCPKLQPPSCSKPFWALPKFLNTKELHVGGQMPLRLEIFCTNS